MYRLQPHKFISKNTRELIYEGVLEKYNESTHVWSTDGVTNPKVFLIWPRLGIEPIPKNEQEIADVLAGTPTSHASPPLIVRMDITEVDTLSLGHAGLIDVYDGNGNTAYVDDITINDGICEADFSHMTGRAVLFPTPYHALSINITSTKTITINNTVRIYGNLHEDGDVKRDWNNIHYASGKTLVTFPKNYTGESQLLMDEGNIYTRSLRDPDYKTYQVAGTFPGLGLTSDYDTFDPKPFIHKGSTYYNLSKFQQNTVRLLLPTWIYGPLERDSGNFGPLPASQYIQPPETIVYWNEIVGRPTAPPSHIDQAVEFFYGFEEWEEWFINQLDLKVDKVEGKGLSDRNYTTIHYNRVVNLPSDTINELSKKVDLDGGNIDTTAKGQLQDVLDIDKKVRLDATNIDESSKTALQSALEIDNKVDKIEGMGLSTNDYNNTDKGKVDNVPADTNAELGGKVDKVAGKGLSTNDYVNIDKAKVDNVPDDTNAELASKVDLDGDNIDTTSKGQLQTALDITPRTLSSPCVEFAAPIDTGEKNIHFEISIFNPDGTVITTGDTATSQDGWVILDGTSVASFPAAGVGSGQYGLPIRFTPQSGEFNRGTSYYSRYRAKNTDSEFSTYQSHLLYW